MKESIVKRTPEQVKNMISLIVNEINSLPSHDIFGGSNAESVNELNDWRNDLEKYQTTGVLPADKYNEVYIWLVGTSFSSLQDME